MNILWHCVEIQSSPVHYRSMNSVYNNAYSMHNAKIKMKQRGNIVTTLDQLSMNQRGNIVITLEQLTMKQKGNIVITLDQSCLDRVLRSAARLIGRIPKYDHISIYMRDILHWLPARQRIEYRM